MDFALPGLLPEFDFIFFNQSDFTFPSDDVGINNALLNIATGRNIKHGSSEYLLHNTPQSAGSRFTFYGFFGDFNQSIGFKLQFHPFVGKQLLILANQGIFRLG